MPGRSSPVPTDRRSRKMADKPIQVLHGDERPDEEALTVFERSKDGTTQIWMEGEDGDCSLELSDAERFALIKALGGMAP
jgi:hypothetical protein